MIRRQALSILILTLTLFISLGLPVRPTQAQLSIEEEKKLGEEFHKAALMELQLIEDPEVVGFVSKVGQDVVNHLEVHIFPYHFYVVDSPVLNAFAAPAGYVFINRGLIEIMEREGELAAILGHEVAHVQSRHISQRMARAKKLSLATLGGLLAGIFLGGDAGPAVIAASQAGSASMQLQYSRSDEEEADRKGLRYLEAAGYQGDDFVTVMKKMGQQSWHSSGSIPTYLKTHPGVPERVNYLEATLQTRPKSSVTRKDLIGDPDGFRMMQAKLLGKYEKTTEAETRLREWLDQPGTQVMAYYGLGLLMRRQSKMQEAVDFFKKAISMRPDIVYCLVELGETYFEMGQLDKAIAVLQSALTLQPNQPATIYLMGRSLLEQGDVAEAETYLSRAAHLNAQLPDIHYHLGMAYGQLNRLGEAHYHFGIYYQHQGSTRNAIFHFQEALRLTDNPALQEKIRKALEGLRKSEREARQEEQPRPTRIFMNWTTQRTESGIDQRGVTS